MNTHPTIGQRRSFWLIVAAGGALRLAWALYATQEPVGLVESGDAFAYFHFGQELAAGRGYINIINGAPTAYYPVGYPAILAVLFWLTLHSPVPDDLVMVATLANVAMATASVALVGVIARRLFGSRVGLVAAGITAVFPNLIFYTATVQLETAFILLTLAAVAVLVTHNWSAGPPSRRRIVAFGVVLGASVVVRPFSLPLLAGLTAALLVSGSGWRRALGSTAWAGLAVVVMMSPWTVRNLVAMDAFVPFSTNGGDTLCIDRSLDATGSFRWSSHEGCASGEGVSAEEYEVHQNAANTRLALRFVRQHPGKELRLIVARGRAMMANDHDGLVFVEGNGNRPFLGARLRGLLSTVADWTFYGVAVLAVLGLPAFLRRRRPDVIFVLAALAALTAVPLLLWGNTRFHLPMLPFLAMAAAVPLARLLPVRRAT